MKGIYKGSLPGATDMTDGTQTQVKLPGDTHTKQLGLHKTETNT